MKKILWMLFLGTLICWAGITTEISAAETAPEHEETVPATYEDVSDEILQEGGLLQESNATGRLARFSAQSDMIRELSDTQKQIQDKLLKAWDSFADTCDLSSFQITPDELRNFYANTLNSNPKYFYVSGAYAYSYSSGGFVTNVRIDYTTEDKNTAKAMRDAYEQEVTAIVSRADKSWSDMEKALYINDYLARNCEYDRSLSKHTAYDVFINKTAVCQGYALAFMDLAHELGLACEMVSSVKLNHAWDMVKIGNSYYNVDVTWNDPTLDRLGRARHLYLLKSTDFFESETGGHAASDWVLTGGLSKSAATETKYDSYFWNMTDTGFEYINGSWYGFDGQDSIYQYACNGTDLTAVKPLIKINDVWNVIGNDLSFWQGKYVGTGAFDGKLYYSGKYDIYEWDPATEKSAVVFSLSEEQKKTGHIYGINLQSSGELKYLFAPSPNEEGTVYLAKTFALTTVDISGYQISLEKQENFVFDGKEKCPSVTVKNGSSILAPSNYTVTYSQNIHAGTAGITVTGKGNYTGTIRGTFKIQKADNKITATTKHQKTAKTSAQSLKLNARAKGGTIKYQSNNKNVTVNAKGTVTIKKNFVGKATITCKAGNQDYKDCSAKITITVNPAGSKLSQAKNLSGRKLSVKWKKNSKVSGYQIQYAVNRKFSGAKLQKVSGASKTKATIKGLKKGKTYYVRIRTYKTVSKSPYYSAWSTAKKVKIVK